LFYVSLGFPPRGHFAGDFQYENNSVCHIRGTSASKDGGGALFLGEKTRRALALTANRQILRIRRILIDARKSAIVGDFTRDLVSFVHSRELRMRSAHARVPV